MQDAGLHKRLIEEAVRIPSDRMAAGVEPDLLTLPLHLLEMRQPEIQVIQFRHQHVNGLAEAGGTVGSGYPSA